MYGYVRGILDCEGHVRVRMNPPAAVRGMYGYVRGILDREEACTDTYEAAGGPFTAFI